MPSERFCGHCSLGRHGVGCVLEGKCGSLLLLVVCVECWGNFEQRVAGGERWIFNFAFCVLAVSPPHLPWRQARVHMGSLENFWSSSLDVYLIMCARDVGPGEYTLP